MHEASLHEENAFVTLTYDDEHLPAAGSLDPAAFPLFMRRLRKAVRPRRVRYFYCGEYGEQMSRPHYHAVLFNWFPADAVACGSRGDHRVYRSATLAELWSGGWHEVGDVTFDSAAYVARYVTKKVRGAAAGEHYAAVDPESGEVFARAREFAQMSRRPGIGQGWFQKFSAELEPEGTVIESGQEVPMPRYYRKLMEVFGSEGAAARLARAAAVRQFRLEPKQSVEQLQRNEKFQKAKFTQTRSLE